MVRKFLLIPLFLFWGIPFQAESQSGEVVKPTLDPLIYIKSKEGVLHQDVRNIRDIALDFAGNIFLLDSFHLGVQKFTNDGHFLTNWGATTDKSKRIGDSLAIDPKGNLYLLTMKGVVFKYTNKGVPLQQYAPKEIEPGQYEGTTSIRFSNGHFFILDRYHCKVQIFDQDFHYLSSFELPSELRDSGRMKYCLCRNMAVDSLENIYLDSKGEIDKYDKNGKLLKRVGYPGNGHGEFMGINGIAVGSMDRIYVIDRGRIQVFDDDLNFLMQFKPREMVQHLAIDGHGYIYTAGLEESVEKFAKYDGPFILKNAEEFTKYSDDHNSPDYPLLEVGPDGKIPPTFWRYSPRIEKVTSELKTVNSKDDLIVFGKKYSKFSGQDSDEDTSPDKGEFLKKLKEMGFIPEAGTESGFFQFKEIQSPHLYYWCFNDLVYGIFPEDPHQAVEITRFPGKFTGVWRINEVISAEKMGPGCYRFSKSESGKYEPSSTLTISDVDLNRKKMDAYSSEGYLKDLDHNGKNEWIYYLSTGDKFEIFLWPYVFSWDGQSWANVSATYPIFYKTEAFENLKSVEKCCVGQYYTDPKLVALLEQAALAGGPSAFSK